ncbi:S8 family serine peptidase [Kribbella sp. NPDC056345]|uniref:S8 family serine peptidase n=1 Tax=Kribbella sp. NPDC056345 TaxID=3345789 RepID=UPI0035E042B3
MKSRPAHLLRLAVPAALVAGSVVVLTGSSGQAAEPGPYRPPFPARQQTAKTEFQPNEVIVKFKSGATSKARTAALSRFRATGEASLTPNIVKVTGSASAPELLKKVKADPTVELASLNYIRRIDAIPNDSYYNEDQRVYLNTIRMPQAWDLSKSTGNQVVAVLDTGVDAGHPDLVGHLVPGVNTTSPNRGPIDDNGHGTMTLGIIAAAANNNAGVAGIGWNVKAMPVKVLRSDGTGDDLDVVEGIDWAAAHGAKVINMSLSGGTDSTIMHDAVKRAVAKGVTVVVAAGNQGLGLPRYPAAYPEVITVGATDPGGTLTGFSSYGDWVDVAAPGTDILSTGVRSMTPQQNVPYWYCTGTSCSAPIVSGIAALVKNKWPNYTPDQVKARIKNLARDAGPRGTDKFYGGGILDAYASLGGRWTTDFPVAAADNNDQPARATAVTTTAAGSTVTEGDVDWYKVNSAAARNLRVSVTGPKFDETERWANFAPRVDVYNGQLKFIGSAEKEFPDFDGNGNPIWAPLTAATNVSALEGDTYIAVRNSNGSRDARTYTLKVEAGTAGTTTGPDYPVFNAVPNDMSLAQPVAVKPSVTFASDVDAATVNESTVRLVNGKTGAAVASTVAYDAASKTATITPASALLDNSPYRIVVNGVHESGAAVILTPFSSVFSTVDLVPAALETFDASGSFQKANLGWKIPALGDLDQIIVRRNTGGKYPTPTTGTLVYSGTASSFANTALPQSTTYTYSAWVKDRSGKLSAGKGTQLLGMKSGISTTSTKLNIGGSITLKGSTLGIDGKAYPTLPMSIYSRPANGTTFKLLKTLGSSSTGTVSYTFKPGYSAVYMLTFAGNGDLMGTRTNDITVLVTPTISSTLSPSTVKLGSTTKLSGVVTPAHSGKSVQLQRLVGKTWTVAGSAKLSSSGAYAFGIKPPYKGKIAYRVYFPSDGDHTLAYSAIRTLTIT